MIRPLKYITKIIYRVDKNTVLRCYGQDDITIDNTNINRIISRKPFIVEQDGRRFLFTSNPNTVIPEECDYALLINHQINCICPCIVRKICSRKTQEHYCPF